MISGDDPTAHQLRLLLTLAEELHFGRAASRLYLTQPALSQQIRSLEHRLGVQLFTRTSRRVELTTTGYALLPLAKKVVAATDELRSAARHAAPGAARLRLGVCESFAALGSTRSVIAMISARHPDLGPDIQVSDFFIEQLSTVQEGEIDAAFVYLPVPNDLHAQPLTTEPRLACVSSSDPLARRQSVRLADLADYPMVSLAPATFRAGRDFWAMDPRPDGSRVRYTTHRITKFESLLSAVSLSRAIAFVPAVAAELYPRPDLSYLLVEDLPGCTFGVVWRPTDHRKPQIAVLEEICHQLREQGLAAGTKPAPVPAWTEAGQTGT